MATSIKATRAIRGRHTLNRAASSREAAEIMGKESKGRRVRPRRADPINGPAAGRGAR